MDVLVLGCSHGGAGGGDGARNGTSIDERRVCGLIAVAEYG